MKTKLSPEVAARQAIEKRIAKSIIKEMLARNFLVGIDNGGDDDEIVSDVQADLDKRLMETDQDRLHFYVKPKAEGEKPKYFGFALLVYGNSGWDVLADYSSKIEELTPETHKLIEELSA